MIAQDFSRVSVLGAFGSARGPAPPCEGAASAVCVRQDLRNTGLTDWN